MESSSAYQRKSIEQFEAALAIYTELDDRTGQALTLQHLSHCYRALRQFAKAAELLEQALAIPRSCPSVPAHQAELTCERSRLFFPPEAFVRSCASETYAPRPQNEKRIRLFANNVPSPNQPESFTSGMRRVRLLRHYPAPEESAFRWGAVPCPLSPSGLAPWVLARMEHIRSMDYPVMQQQMLDFVDMVIDLSAQQRRRKKAYIHSASSSPELWSLFQVAFECRRSVEFWTVFSTVLDYFSAFNEQTE